MSLKSFYYHVELNGSDVCEPAEVVNIIEYIHQSSHETSIPNTFPTWVAGKLVSPLKPFELECEIFANSTFYDLLQTEDSVSASIEPVTLTIESLFSGDVQLSKLSNIAKDHFALLVAKRKVISRNQDFKDFPSSGALAFGAFFGRNHIHQANGTATGSPHIEVADRGAADDTFDACPIGHKFRGMAFGYSILSLIPPGCSRKRMTKVD